MEKEQWISEFGVAGVGDYVDDFEDLVLGIQELFLPLEGRVSYRDMYEIAAQAAAKAVAGIVSTRNNRNTAGKRS